MSDLPRGLYDRLITEGLDRRLAGLDPASIEREGLDAGDAHLVLARHLAELARIALLSIRGDEDSIVSRRVELANRIANAITSLVPQAGGDDALVAESRDVFQAVANHSNLPGLTKFPQRPEIPLSASALLVNGRDQPRIGNEVKRELVSADRVDLLCAFVKWHGLRILEPEIDALIQRGGSLRVITTTYIGATEQRALDRLAELGAEVKVSYETRTTRLHAKAWLFDRATGFSTAYVGSSNLSKAAMLDGLEWNVRLTSIEQAHLLDTFSGNVWGLLGRPGVRGLRSHPCRPT